MAPIAASGATRPAGASQAPSTTASEGTIPDFALGASPPSDDCVVLRSGRKVQRTPLKQRPGDGESRRNTSAVSTSAFDDDAYDDADEERRIAAAGTGSDAVIGSSGAPAPSTPLERVPWWNRVGWDPNIKYSGWPHDKPPVPGRDFRPAGIPASRGNVFPHMPLWHNAFCDPYERVNVFSHGIPCLVFVTLLALSLTRRIPGGAPLAAHCAAVSLGHLASTITHLSPDSKRVEKLDHAGIALWIVSTTYTALKAACPHMSLAPYYAATAITMACVAIPFHKVRAFTMVLCGAFQAVWYFRGMFNDIFGAELALYLLGALLYLRGHNYNDKYFALSDHHLMHYCVTMAAFVHVIYILRSEGAIVAPWPFQGWMPSCDHRLSACSP